MTTFSAKVTTRAVWAGLAIVLLSVEPLKAQDVPTVLKDHRIGYLLTEQHWSVYQTDDVKRDCPDGLNGNGPRENFHTLFPDGGSVEKTQLARESLRVFPADQPRKFPYIFAKGPIALGLNLDGKVGPNDFVSPAGEKGIKNQLFRVMGCNASFRAPDGQLQLFANKLMSQFPFDRTLIEITNVENLVNADNVDVTIYRGRDPMLLGGTADKVAPGGSQRIDMHYGKTLIQHLHGHIANGVLTTDPIEQGNWPWAIYYEVPRVLHVHDMRLSLKLTPTSADGLLGGYTDVASLYRWVTSWSTHNLAYGRLDPAEFYWALLEKADAYPNGKGEMTAISSAISVGMTQVFIEHGNDGLVAAQLPAQEQAAAGK